MRIFEILVLVVVYFLPSVIAWTREHRYAWCIFALNLVVGWTVIGWVIAMVCAFVKPARAGSGIANEIQELGKLKEQGLLTDEEFQKGKNEILSGV